MTKRERGEFEFKAEPAAEWSCGHVAGSVCAECYRQLAAKAHALAEEVQRLRDAIDDHAEEIRAALDYRQP